MAEPKTGNTIETRQDWLVRDDARHQLNRDLREGVPAMAAAALAFRYMKPNPGELTPINSDADLPTFTLGQISVNGHLWSRYALRVERSDLPNPWSDSISDTARLPFRSRIVLDGWNPELQGGKGGKPPGWVANMDGQGRSLDELAHESFEDALYEGPAFWFVDNDQRSFATKAQRNAAGARPWVTKLKRSDFRKIVPVSENGVYRLKRIEFDQPRTETNYDDPNNWTEEVQEAIKVVIAGDLDAEKGSDERKVRWELWVKNAEGDFEAPPEGEEGDNRRGFITPDNPAEELTEIPLVFMPSDRTGPWRAQSPYLGTAPTQKAIWVFNSEVSGLAREVTQSRWYETGEALLEPGVSGGKDLLPDGSGARWKFSTAPGADLKLIESSGQPLVSIRELIKDKTEQIRDSHHVIETRRPVQATATEIGLQDIHANSSLEQWVILALAGWKQTLDLMALLAGHSERGTVDIPHDFGAATLQDDSWMDQMMMADRFPPRQYFEEKVRRGKLDEKFDIDAAVDYLEKDKASAERSRERLERDMAGALKTPDNDDEEEDQEDDEDETEEVA